MQNTDVCIYVYTHIYAHIHNREGPWISLFSHFLSLAEMLLPQQTTS